MTAPTKADKAAAERVLKTAVRKAVAMTRDGNDPRPLLVAAVVSADSLLEAS